MVQYDGLHADKRPILYCAAVQHGLMPDRNTAPDIQGDAFINVQYAAFLDIASLANGNAGIVAANGNVRPDADAGGQVNVADDIGAVENERVRVNVGCQVFELVDRHGYNNGKGVKGLMIPNHCSGQLPGCHWLSDAQHTRNTHRDRYSRIRP